MLGNIAFNFYGALIKAYLSQIQIFQTFKLSFVTKFPSAKSWRKSFIIFSQSHILDKSKCPNPDWDIWISYKLSCININIYIYCIFIYIYTYIYVCINCQVSNCPKWTKITNKPIGRWENWNLEVEKIVILNQSSNYL